ncbi:MAG: efflux RND transporter periplasmic adaptor subunit [Deltaproteobacteria bacterium]|nr:efflux RND transporter periplasmic adaptor subunit [Deltaproteobacteria bacterium]
MTKRRLIHLGITVVLVMLGVFGMRALTSSKPEMKKSKPTTPVPMVRTVTVTTGPQAVHVLGEGTVRPLREINLVPQIGGKVVYVSPSLVNGGRFSKGDTLLRIDPADYEIAVTLAEAKVKNSESLLRMAEEEAAAAQEEWRLLHADDSKSEEKPPPLVAKEPQLAAAMAGLKADRADLDRALLNLERTRLKAPFAGRVSQEEVGIGQYVSPGQPLANLYSTEAAEIVVPLENESIFWFHVPGFTPGKSAGSSAEIRARIAGREQTWVGRVVRTEGKLDERTRTINVVVRVEKPYAKKPPLAVGLFVPVDIEGRTLADAALIPRSALREGNMVWVVENDDRLRFRQVEVGRVQGDEALVTAGLENGERVVITPLKVVSDGMAVRTAPVEEETQS